MPTDIRAALMLLGIEILCYVVAPESFLTAAALIAVKTTAVVCLAALLIFARFYHHAVTTIGNRAALWESRPMIDMFMITKPLELLWRFCTAPLRCVPDIVLIGEVRCGTTTLADHIKSIPGARGPFCAFIHPLDGKESFYFAGHYFGIVHPLFYRAMFPFRLERWWYTQVLGRPFFVLDGCAQYMTAPWAPALMNAAAPGVRLIACIREPVSQNLSWWQFEHAAMKWFDSMGLGPVGVGVEDIRTSYPPRSLLDALELSSSAKVTKLYHDAEKLSSCWILPRWAVTWPNGQLSALSRNGIYVDNLTRWLKYFPRDRIEVIELNQLAKDLLGVFARLERHFSGIGRSRYILRFPKREDLHLNASSPSLAASETSAADLNKIREFYAPHNERLYALLGQRFDW